LYVDDSRTGHVYAFDVSDNGLLDNRRSFARVGVREPGKGSADGMKVDVEGNVFVTGPKGISVFCPDGMRYGVIGCPEIPANIAWGDEDYKTLYITARTGVYCIRLTTGGTSSIPDFKPTPVI
jgi:sugar lactone lactonase YvrE